MAGDDDDYYYHADGQGGDDDYGYYNGYDDRASSQSKGFDGYIPTTIDPAPWALIVTLSICIALILILPFFVAIRQYWLRKKSMLHQNLIEEAELDNKATDDVYGIYKEAATMSSKDGGDDRYVLLCGSSPTKTNDDYMPNYHLRHGPGRAKFQHFRSFGRLLSGVFRNRNTKEVTRTVKLIHQNALNQQQDVEAVHYQNAMMNQQRNGMVAAPPPPRVNATTSNSKFASSSAADVTNTIRTVTTKVSHQIATDINQDIETEYVNIEINHCCGIKLPQREQRPISAMGQLRQQLQQAPTTNTSSDEDLLNYDSYDDANEKHRPISSEFADEFFCGENYDGKDNSDPAKQQQQRLRTQEGYYVPMNGGEDQHLPQDSKSNNTHTKYDIHLCTGRRPWCTYYCSRGFIRKVYKCMSYDDEMKKIMKLALPYTIHGVMQDVLSLLEIAVISNLFASSNGEILGGYFAIDMIISLTTMLIDGAVNSLTILCSHAVGARNLELAGKYVQLAIIVYFIVLFPFMAYFWVNMEGVILWLGFDDEVAAQAQDYGRFAFWVTAVNAIDTSVHHILDVTGLVWFSAIISISHYVANLFSVLLIGLLAEPPRLWMIGLCHLCLSVFFTTLTIAICLCKDWLRGFWVGLASNSLKDWQAIRTFAKTAGPLSIGYIIEYGEWEILFIFSASMGPAEVTVWGLLGYLWAFAEHFGEGIAEAAEVRVAKLIGSNKPALACYSSHKSVFLGVCSAGVLSIIILCLQYQIAEWLTPDETLQEMLRETLPLICVGVAALTFGSMSWTLLCAQGRTKLATAISFFGSVFVTLPLAAISTFAFNFNIQGLVASIIIGYSIGGIFNSFLMVTTNWLKICNKVASRNIRENADFFPKFLATVDSNASKVENYDDYDWNELPQEVKDSAKLLGYSKRLWDNDLPTKLDDKDWDELTPEQQNAAKIFGYDEAKWNGGTGGVLA